MKKVLLLILALTMALALFACTNQKKEEDDSSISYVEDDGLWSERV